MEARIFPTVLGGDTAGGALALTFNAGPTPRLTERIGALLSRRGHRATFPVLEDRVDRQPEVICTLLQQGHEVAVHGLRHERLTQQAPRQLQSYLMLAVDRLAALWGRSARLLHPCFNARTGTSCRATCRARLTLVGWTVDVEDCGAKAPRTFSGSWAAGFVPVRSSYSTMEMGTDKTRSRVLRNPL